MRRFYLSGLGASILALLLSGCSHGNNSPAPAASGSMTPAQIQAIENNPKISPQMKAGVLAQSQSK